MTHQFSAIWRVDGEGCLFRQHRMQQRPVEQAHVVGGDDDALAGSGNVLEARHLQPKKKAEHLPSHVAYQARAPGAHDDQHSAEAEHAERGEQHAEADAGRLQPGHDGAGADHVGRIQDVDGGDHAGAPLRRRPGLHGRERRHDVEAARQPPGRTATGAAQAAGRHQHAERTDRLAARRGADRHPGDRQREHADQDGAQRHQRQIGLAVAGAGRQRRAQRDADREGGKAQRHHALAAADAVLDQGRQQRQRHEADQPEPRHDVRAAPQARIALLQLAQQRHRRGPGIARDGEVGRGRTGLWE